MTATVVIHGRGVSVTDKVREYAEKKVGRLDHYLPEISEVRIELSAARAARDADDRQVVQLTVPLRGVILRCEERAGDVMTGIDMALEKMRSRIERYKTKRRRGRGNGLNQAEAALEAETEAESAAEIAGGPMVVRRKKFPITPMTEAEAIEQMTFSQHENFFIFYNADTAKINVLYVRKDGNFGLIEPEIA